MFCSCASRRTPAASRIDVARRRSSALGHKHAQHQTRDREYEHEELKLNQICRGAANVDGCGRAQVQDQNPDHRVRKTVSERDPEEGEKADVELEVAGRGEEEGQTNRARQSEGLCEPVEPIPTRVESKPELSCAGRVEDTGSEDTARQNETERRQRKDADGIRDPPGRDYGPRTIEGESGKPGNEIGSRSEDADPGRESDGDSDKPSHPPEIERVIGVERRPEPCRGGPIRQRDDCAGQEEVLNRE